MGAQSAHAGTESAPAIKSAALRAIADCADALSRLARSVLENAKDADEMVALADAAAEAKCSVRTLTDARRARALTMFGSQRSRTIRRSDLIAWIASREVKPVEGLDDLDLRRRMRRLENARKAKRS